MDNILFPKEITVTGQQIDISHFSDKQKDFVINFTANLLTYYHELQKDRMVVGIAGPSGAGKSLLAALVKKLTQKVPIVPLSIDAFHFSNLQLEQRSDGDGITLKDRKGRYDTYDVGALEQKLKKFTSGENVAFPEYSRKLHEPILDATIVANGPCILIVEGLWLLYEDAGWQHIQQYLDRTYFLNDEPAKLRSHTIARHILGGRSPEDAERQYDASDAKNYELLIQTRTRADEELTWNS